MLGVSAYDLLNLQKSPAWERWASCFLISWGNARQSGTRPHAAYFWPIAQPQQGAPGAGHDGGRRLCATTIRVAYGPACLSRTRLCSTRSVSALATDNHRRIQRANGVGQRRTGAPYGDAILAGVATGILPGFQVAKQWVQYVAQMDPSRAGIPLYGVFLALSPPLQPRQRGLPGAGALREA